MAGQTSSAVAELDDASWTRLTDAVRQLEKSWKAGSGVDFRNFVPSTGDPLRERILVELIKVDQEYRCRSGQQQNLESYLHDWPELIGRREIVSELLEAECLTRSIFDTLPTSDELDTRFPQISTKIDLTKIKAKAESEQPSGKGSSIRFSDMNTSIGTADLTPLEDHDPLQQLIGQRFGRYEIRAVIGQGGMGTVYRALDTKLSREVALKVPRFNPAVEPDVLERFVREARAAARIRHPNICHVYDADEIDGTYFIAMAFIDGETLADRIERQSLDQKEAAEILRKLALALAEVHDADMVHRDIKPSNVIIDTSGEPLLTDFGLVRLAQDESKLTNTGSFLGTLAYMSPEQANAKPVDARSDIYSLGVILYQMLTGRPPFSGPPAVLIFNHLHQAPDPPRNINPRISKDIETICLCCLQKNPQDRYASTGELAEDIERWLECRPVRARPVCAYARAWRWVRRNPVLAGMALVVASLVMMLTVVLWQRARPPQMTEQPGAATKGSVQHTERSTVLSIAPSTQVVGQPVAVEREPVARNRDYAGLPFADQLIRSETNLRMIGRAIEDFHEAIGKYPPAIVYGPHGKPWHSWRVLILPYLGDNEYRNLFEAYDFSQPWDSPANRSALESMPVVYRDPIYGDKRTNFTHYAVVTAPLDQGWLRTIFPTTGIKTSGGHSFNVFSKNGANTKRTDIRDGRSNTILVAPVPSERKIPWTKPEDILLTSNKGARFHAAGIPATPETFAVPYKVGNISAGVFLMADGSTRVLTDRVDLDVLRALCIMDGGEVIDSQEIETLPLPGK